MRKHRSRVTSHAVARARARSPTCCSPSPCWRRSRRSSPTTGSRARRSSARPRGASRWRRSATTRRSDGSPPRSARRAGETPTSTARSTARCARATGCVAGATASCCARAPRAVPPGPAAARDAARRRRLRPRSCASAIGPWPRSSDQRHADERWLLRLELLLGALLLAAVRRRGVRAAPRRATGSPRSASSTRPCCARSPTASSPPTRDGIITYANPAAHPDAPGCGELRRPADRAPREHGRDRPDAARRRDPPRRAAS